jgi:hypothetical protein
MDKIRLWTIENQQQKHKAARQGAALFVSLSIIALLSAGCSKQVTRTNETQTTVTTSADREKQIEQARAEAQAYLAAKPTAAVTSAARPGRRVLANAERSAEALSRSFLRALANQDMKSLQGLRLTKDEFCQYVFPELPSSRLSNVTCDFVWQQATLKSLSGLSEMYPKHQGRKYEFVAMRFAKGTDAYPTYKVYKETHLVVRDESGRQQELRLFGSILEMDGVYKLFSFVID